jgi:hypothetical protein
MAATRCRKSAIGGRGAVGRHGGSPKGGDAKRLRALGRQPARAPSRGNAKTSALLGRERIIERRCKICYSGRMVETADNRIERLEARTELLQHRQPYLAGFARARPMLPGEDSRIAIGRRP